MSDSRPASLDGLCIYQLKLLSEIGSIADLDLRDVDLELAAATAPTQVVEVSVHAEGSVEEPPAIKVSQAPTMDNVIPAPP